jgi:hypothetical protein
VEEMREEGNAIPAVESLMNYRGQGEDELFELWCDNFFRPAYGSAAFRERSRKKPLSAILTVFDEAFVVATINNNYERWMKEAELQSQGLIIDKKKLPKQKYTNDAAASKKYQGWSKEGIDFLSKVVNDLMQVRNTSTSKVLEKNYMDDMNNMQANKSRKVASVPATQAVDGLQAYLKNFFPNLGNYGVNGTGASQAEAIQVGTGAPNKRPRVSLEGERNAADEEDYDDVDESEIGQTSGV